MTSICSLYLDPADNPRLLDQLLSPGEHILENYVRGVYRDGPIDDFRFLRLGVCRVLSQSSSGRDFIQHAREIHQRRPCPLFLFRLPAFGPPPKHAGSTQCAVSAPCLKGLEDLLSGFPELRGVQVFAVDGHHIEHAVHSPSDPKGEKVSASNLYVLCLHTGLFWNFGAVEGDGLHGHENAGVSEGA